MKARLCFVLGPHSNIFHDIIHISTQMSQCNNDIKHTMTKIRKILQHHRYKFEYAS